MYISVSKLTHHFSKIDEFNLSDGFHGCIQNLHNLLNLVPQPTVAAIEGSVVGRVAPTYEGIARLETERWGPASASTAKSNLREPCDAAFEHTGTSLPKSVSLSLQEAASLH